MRRSTDPVDRILAKIRVTRLGCWETHLAISKDGYARVADLRGGRKQYLAHRVIYEHFQGTIPEGLTIDHLCRNRACCNPAHLEPVTTQENTRRGECSQWRLAHTHCVNGHEYTEANTRIEATGARRCKTCNNLAGKVSKQRKQDRIKAGQA